jgi:cytochrome c-type biogenesis protein CcmH
MNMQRAAARGRLLTFLLLALVLVYLALSLSNQSAVAQSPTPTDDEVNRIARQLYCPVCENTPLDVCPTEACRQWRDLIRQQLSEGWSESRIQDYFVEQYGARVLAEPPRTGLNWLVYLLPPVIILTGVIMLLRSFRIWTKPATPGTDGRGGSKPVQPPAAPGADDYMARLEDELKKRN